MPIIGGALRAAYTVRRATCDSDFSVCNWVDVCTAIITDQQK